MLNWLKTIAQNEFRIFLYHWNQQSPEIWATYTEDDDDMIEYIQLKEARKNLQAALKKDIPWGFKGKHRKAKMNNDIREPMYEHLENSTEE